MTIFGTVFAKILLWWKLIEVQGTQWLNNFIEGVVALTCPGIYSFMILDKIKLHHSLFYIWVIYIATAVIYRVVDKIETYEIENERN